MTKKIILFLILAGIIHKVYSMKLEQLLEELQETFIISNQCLFPLCISWDKKNCTEIKPYSYASVESSLLTQSKKIKIHINNHTMDIDKKNLDTFKNTNWTLTPIFTQDFHRLEALHVMPSNGEKRLVLRDKNNSSQLLVKNLINPLLFIKFDQKEDSPSGFNPIPLNIKESIKNLNFEKPLKPKYKDDLISIVNQIPTPLQLCYKTYQQEIFTIRSNIDPFTRNSIQSTLLINYAIASLGLIINGIPFLSECQNLIKALQTPHTLIPIFDEEIKNLIGIIILPYNDEAAGVFFSIDTQEINSLIASLSAPSVLIDYKNSPIFSKNQTHNFSATLLDYAYTN